MSHQSFQSTYSSYSHSSARDTQSTQATSSSTLFNPPPSFPTSSTPVNGGPIEASDNVLNVGFTPDKNSTKLVALPRPRERL